MPADIIELGACQSRVSGTAGLYELVNRLTKPSGVMSVEASPPGVSLESMIIHDGPSCALCEHCHCACVLVIDEVVRVDVDAFQLLDQLGQHR